MSEEDDLVIHQQRTNRFGYKENDYIFRTPQEESWDKFKRLTRKYLWLIIVGCSSLAGGIILNWENVKLFFNDALAFIKTLL